MPYLRRYSPTKLCDGAQMAIFCVLYYSASRVQYIQTCILNSYKCHTVCGSMVDIQSATAEIRRGNKKEERRRQKKRQDKNIMSASAMQGSHKKEEETIE